MTDVTEAGRRLFQSAENLRRSANDLDALLDSLWEMLVERRVDLGEIKEADDENGGGKNAWLATAWAYNATVMDTAERPAGARGRPRRPRPRGTVTFLVRLCGFEDAQEPKPDWPWLDQACLIVGWHRGAGKEDDFWEIANFEPSQGEGFIRSAGKKVWAWHEDGEDYARFFALPIFALRNEDDLKNHVLRPLKVLFEGGGAETAFPSDSPALGAGERSAA